MGVIVRSIRKTMKNILLLIDTFFLRYIGYVGLNIPGKNVPLYFLP